jgi:hypothetical protein
MANNQVNWYENKVRLVVDKTIKQSGANIAFRIEERLKINISEAPGASGQGLVDTGFLLNSPYVVTPEGSSYDQANQSGMYENREGQMVERNIAPERDLPDDALALVAVGAEYAIYQELEHAFFFKAVEDTAGEVGGLIETF